MGKVELWGENDPVWQEPSSTAAGYKGPFAWEDNLHRVMGDDTVVGTAVIRSAKVGSKDATGEIKVEGEAPIALGNGTVSLSAAGAFDSATLDILGSAAGGAAGTVKIKKVNPKRYTIND